MFYFFIRGSEVVPLVSCSEKLAQAKAEEYPQYIFFMAELTTEAI